MLSIPEKVNKIKREVLFQKPSKGCLNFPNFRTTVKALRLSSICRLFNNFNVSEKDRPRVHEQLESLFEAFESFSYRKRDLFKPIFVLLSYVK